MSTTKTRRKTAVCKDPIHIERAFWAAWKPFDPSRYPLPPEFPLHPRDPRRRENGGDE